MKVHKSVFPDELTLSVFFESEPLKNDTDETSLTYLFKGDGPLELKVSFSLLLVNAISVEILLKEERITGFSTEGVKKVELVENSNRLIIAHVEAAGAKGEVWIHLEPKIQLKSFLFAE